MISHLTRLNTQAIADTLFTLVETAGKRNHNFIWTIHDFACGAIFVNALKSAYTIYRVDPDEYNIILAKRAVNFVGLAAVWSVWMFDILLEKDQNNRALKIAGFVGGASLYSFAQCARYVASHIQLNYRKIHQHII